MTNISFEKIACQAEAERRLERDIRNQVVIDQFKRLTWKDRLMILLNDNGFHYAISVCSILWTLLFATLAFGQEPNAIVNGNLVQILPKVQCPTPGEKCKVLFLTEQEERLLTSQNGILDTAAQGRALELGQFAVYLKTRIAAAAQGEVKVVEKPADPAPAK
jgi:hypothetical protein